MRLGGNEEHNRRILAAQSRSEMPSRLLAFVAVLLGTLVLRNLFFHDYREEMIHSLRERGRTDEEIERYVPKTFQERQQYVEDKKNDLKKMKEDIAYLLQAVDELKRGQGVNRTRNGRVL